MFGAGIVCPVIVALAAGEGLAGRWDKYFDVSLVNRTGRTLVVDNHGVTNRLAPGEIDHEWGSSTAHQPISVRVGHAQTCVDLFFAKRPTRPIALRLHGTVVQINGGQPC